MIGEKELMVALGDIAKGAEKETEEAAKHIYVLTKANIMVRSKHPTGRLAASVRLDGTAVSVTAPYAVYVEEGTYKMAGKHYFEDAINTVLPEWWRNIMRRIKL